MQDFVTFLEEKGNHADMFGIKVIFTDSDNLSDRTKSRLKQMFRCPVINRYSNEEHGLLACTIGDSNEFTLNTASYYFELLALDGDRPVQPGETGRLVVTDLYNHSMPFIRYDTGDLAVSFDEERGQLKTLSSIEGRTADVLWRADGTMISAATVNNFLHGYYKIKQYQLVQTSQTDYILKVVCERDAYEQENLVNVCREFLGTKASIKVVYCTSIPVEGNGKYRSLVRLS